jgi:DNA-binding MarR family transcriptional regulator
MPRIPGLSAWDLKPGEIFLMAYLQHGEAGTGFKPSELASRLDVSPGHVTQLITSLEARGLVARAMDAADRRAVRVRLTAAGETAMAAGRAAFAEAFTGLIEHLGPEEAERLTGLLDKSADFFQRKYGSEPGCPGPDLKGENDA